MPCAEEYTLRGTVYMFQKLPELPTKKLTSRSGDQTEAEDVFLKGGSIGA